jgi:hypothetical protein
MFSYEQAVAKEAEIKPFVKGEHKGDKPLAERARHWLTIRKHGENVVVRLHKTDIITYRPNSEIVIEQGGWNSATTHETVARILGTHIQQRHSIGWIYVKNGCFPLRKRGANVFLRERGRNGEPEDLFYLNPEYPVIHKLKLKVYNQVKKRYTDFYNYAVNMTKLTGNTEYDYEQLRNLRIVENRNFLLSRGEFSDHSVYPTIVKWMLSEDYEDRNKALICVYHFCDRMCSEPLVAVHNSITDLIKRAHRDEVFAATEVRDGRVVRDNNAGYFK